MSFLLRNNILLLNTNAVQLSFNIKFFFKYGKIFEFINIIINASKNIRFHFNYFH